MIPAMPYLLRLRLSDRPGSLGAVAGALGEAGVDILALDVVEHADGTAVDEMVLHVPPGVMPDTAVSACTSVPGVQVEFVTPYPAGAALSRDLEVVELMAADPARAEHALTEAVPDLFRLAWGVVLTARDGIGRPEHASLGAPSDAEVPVPWLPLVRARRVDAGEGAPPGWAGALVAAAPLAGRDRTLVIGRYGGPEVLGSEVARLGYLATLAATLTTTTGDGPAGGGAATAVGLDHVVLTVAEVESSVAWYSQVLGAPPVRFGDGRRAVQLGPSKINFHAADDPQPAPVADHRVAGSADVCVVVPGPVADVLAHLAAHEVPVVDGPVRRTGARGPMTSVYVRDPDGNLVELGCYAG
jgi:catechol 2,3-dioxygenase-like lactoylglutathione lyase family enzyme